ncbi:acyl-CoA dehydrogenase family protein [Mycolicibacterium goodii]|jgi:alkylation response protein AidB-like acyl-CoA dehydrogenase|uniref:Acyl-CoA dehydrogenase family protein n=1 Tax=Mycolicibacterium goodii TaxID=134601 RepID=A0ABS6HUQ6_MYCGD|nr:acyl-CoA dehydrogenase family protein [Mycolicibacterium goodii]OKH72999.1 acyl-CoA dehydrogenase [Mycobacterium sp. SWH-M5]MBU8813102.1 acyl-CoA dehydrogenase family protein [Mycolicibacterium goodii]MBU8816661.1 acyl-CoA dehydrogenase family protein [Mycolicibacterium goodii]MBU8826305.1 acyl-CoA dehydrogenase family protein [Mycolicibacterium goodii]MBU8828807.1 acyl-CoA dehydrogenase family protein [Mycolicibacterium goodii]
MTAATLSAVVPDPAWRDLREQVRKFIADELAAQRFEPGIDGWLTGWSDAFSRSLAERGWVGMTIPRQYGGHGRSHFERFVVTEELLIAGAPVAAHWIADRQVAPSLLRYGTEEQKKELLPAIAAARCTFAIGMSEPDSGSDLASVRTRGVPVDGGWLLNGTKVWTSGAHHADKILVLARTSGSHDDRHRGLSQLIVDLKAPGVEIVPIESLDGGHHFNEVVFTDCFVPANDLLGAEGQGWKQVTEELGFERSGPERFLSTAVMVRLLIEHVAQGDISPEPVLGQFVARLHGLHQMSLSVAAALDRGENADAAAAMVKMLGTTTEGDLVEAADYLIGSSPGPLRDAVARATAQRPGFTLRGGTNEVLAGVIARGLGLR